MDFPAWLEESMDKFTRFFTVISGDHRYTHEGKGYMFSGKTASLAQNVSETLQFTTPLSRSGIGSYIHLRPPSFSSTASLAEARFAESSSVSGGSAAVAVNKRRSSPDQSAALLKTAVTIGSEGTVLMFGTAGSGGNPSSVRGGTSGESADQEIILKPGTTYTMRMENLASTATVIYYSLTWYEETKG